MKKFIIILTAMFTMTATANAMGYEQARQQALFLTDKMAYELNLTEQQYEAAYEINLDYLMSVNIYDDLYGAYWTHRNLDLSYILLDWQYRAYCAASYFYRPLYWDAGYWRFGIYARYPHRDYFYFGRPHAWSIYRGGHSWHRNGGRSWYHGRDFGHRGGPRGGAFRGMRDGIGGPGGHRGGSIGGPGGHRGGSIGGPGGRDNRTFGNGGRDMGGNRGGSFYGRPDGGNRGGYFSGGNRGGYGRGDGNRGYSSRESSTRTTVTHGSNMGGSRPSGSYFGGSRGGSYGGSRSSGFSGGSRGGGFSGGHSSGGSHFGGGGSHGGGSHGGGHGGGGGHFGGGHR